VQGVELREQQPVGAACVGLTHAHAAPQTPLVSRAERHTGRQHDVAKAHLVAEANVQRQGKRCPAPALAADDACKRPEAHVEDLARARRRDRADTGLGEQDL
jgi:hypothetical protein